MRPSPILAFRKVQPSEAPVIIATVKGLADWWLALEQRSVTVVGMDTEYATPVTVPLPGSRFWTDMSAIRPLLLGLVAIVGDRAGNLSYHCASIVLLGAEDGLQAQLATLLRRRWPFACHWQRAEYSSLSVMGLPRPAYIHDTWLAERHLHLGADPVVVEDEGEDEEEEDGIVGPASGHYSLLETAKRYGLQHRHAHRKAALEQRFAAWNAERNQFQPEDHAYVVEDARISAELYRAQCRAMLEAGTLHRFLTLEAPAAQALTELT